MAYMDSSVQIIGALLLLMGSIYAITKCVKRIMQYYLVAKHGITTNARVIAVKENYSSQELPFVAVVSYTTANGNQVTATAGEATYIKPNLNVELRIIYDPLHPARFFLHQASLLIGEYPDACSFSRSGNPCYLFAFTNILRQSYFTDLVTPKYS